VILQEVLNAFLLNILYIFHTYSLSLDQSTHSSGQVVILTVSSV
jgi:hypothetical protein